MGVQRQYSGTAGRVETGSSACSPTPPRAGRALINRPVYLPRSWADDPQRCCAARRPERVGFATKPELALEMLTEAAAAKMPAAWVASDEAYGDNGAFRAGIAELGLGYVLAVSRTPIPGLAGRQTPAARRPHRRGLAAQMAAPVQRWDRLQRPALV